jgi:hypothetical protein
MKDYARRNSNASRPNVRQELPRERNPDRWLIVFIIITLCLAAASAGYTFYQKWRTERATTAALAEKPLHPAKSILEKLFRKQPEKHELQDKTKLPGKLTKKSPKSAEPKVETSNEPKYDFYQLLPKMTVDVPHTDDNTAQH